MIDKRLHDLFAMEERKRKIVFENLPQPKKLFYKKKTTYTCFLISLYLLHTRKGNFFERWYSSVHPVYVIEIFSTFQLLTFNFAFFFRYKVHLQIIINICLQGVIACKAALSCIQELKRACLLPCISVPFSEW